MSQICSKIATSYFQPILVAIFVTIAMVKVELMPDFGEKQFLFFSLKGGLKKPLNAHTPLYPVDMQYSNKYVFTSRVENSVGLDQVASSESGSAVAQW